MAAWNDEEAKKRGIYWPAFVAILLGQILILLALGVVVVRYLEWSSDTNQSEFTSAAKRLPSDGVDLTPSGVTVERVKAPACRPAQGRAEP
jgi:hypothetical protein